MECVLGYRKGSGAIDFYHGRWGNFARKSFQVPSSTILSSFLSRTVNRAAKRRWGKKGGRRKEARITNQMSSSVCCIGGGFDAKRLVYLQKNRPPATRDRTHCNKQKRRRMFHIVVRTHFVRRLSGVISRPNRW